MAKKKKTNETKEKLLVAVISIIIGVGLGFGIGALADSESDNAKMESSDMMAHSHSSTYEVEAENAPTVDFIVEEDSKSGWNIKILTSNFTFTPENVNKENVLGEGHAHLYVDGKKVARVYSEYFHYGGNFDGTKTFEVELNTNDHSVYTLNGEKISVAKQVSHNQDSSSHDSDNHSHMDMKN